MVNCQAWAYINRERKKRTVCTTDIKIEEWRKYFKDLLEGEDKYTRVREEKDEMEPEENQISEMEVKKQIKRLKKNKAAGEDNIENEAWMYGNPKIVRRLTEIINKVWRGDSFPERWKEGMISPIFKKGDREKVNNYRGITILMNTAYKIYAMVLERRLKDELESKKIIPEA